jgi:hypothetical protein
LLLSSEHAHLLEVSSTARSQRALNFEFFKSLEIVGFFNNLKGFAKAKPFFGFCLSLHKTVIHPNLCYNIFYHMNLAMIEYLENR